jgi:hypothetical protein
MLHRAPILKTSNLLRSVVLPEPRNPVKIVTGTVPGFSPGSAASARSLAGGSSSPPYPYTSGRDAAAVMCFAPSSAIEASSSFPRHSRPLTICSRRS